jgi:hypothetical protein
VFSFGGRNFGLFVLRQCSVFNGGRNFGLFVSGQCSVSNGGRSFGCLSSPGHIRKVNTFSLGYLLHKHTFAFFLMLLTQILINHLAPVVTIVHALDGHVGLRYGSTTTAISLFTTLLLHF